jgi:hypothetical protein
MYTLEVVTVDGNIRYIDTVELDDVFGLQWDVLHHPADYGISCEINRVIIRKE